MSSQRSLDQASPALPIQLFDVSGAPGAPASRFYAEDGWIFREYPGKGIEIICRYDPAAASLALQEQA